MMPIMNTMHLICSQRWTVDYMSQKLDVVTLILNELASLF